MKYIFVLGRDPELSKAEIESYLEARKIPFTTIDNGKEALVIELSTFEKKIIKELGGTIKIAELLSSERRLDRIEYTLKEKELYKGSKNKITYSITALETDLDSFLEDYLKDYFKGMHLKALHKKEVSPSQLSQRKDALDFGVFRSHIGITIAVSNPKELKRRDLERPAVDHMKVISLRLAKILINLSEAKENSLFLDPFCGSGSILQEALLLGCKVRGVDKDPESIRQAKLNLEWLKQNYPLKEDYTLHYSDARKLTLYVPIKSIDAVATEPYLGPFIRKIPSIFEAITLIEDLTNLYAQVLNQLSQVLKKGKKLIFITPRFKTKEGKTLFLNFEVLAKEHGFDPEKKFFYAYPESKLLRDIHVLRKN